MNSIGNPLTSLRGWHANARAAQTKPAGAPSYKEALEVFEKDRLHLQAQDLPANGKTPIGAVVLGWSDTNPNPGEVSVPHVGSLRSTPEGFSLRVLENDLKLFLRPRKSKTYSVSEGTGNILVLNTVDSHYAPTNLGVANSKLLPGYRESYVMDTKNGTIENYKKTLLTSAGQNSNDAGLIADRER